MSTMELNNLWAYIEGLSLKQKDREWLAGKLLEPKTDDVKTARQQAYVKETLTPHLMRSALNICLKLSGLQTII